MPLGKARIHLHTVPGLFRPFACDRRDYHRFSSGFFIVVIFRYKINQIKGEL